MNPYSMSCESCHSPFEITRKEEYLNDSALCVPLPKLCKECRAQEQNKKSKNDSFVYTY